MRKACLLAVFNSIVLLGAAVSTPREHFGFTPGDDYKIADYSQISSYFLELASVSNRIRVQEFGKTSYGKPMYAAFISSPENLRHLTEYQEINAKLALGNVPDAEARQLAQRGKVFVWIDSGLHATEIAPAQHAAELAYRMLTDESAEMQRIRSRVILIQIPSINPDGLDMVAKWYRGNVGTPYELAPLPYLYQKYSGHDNNRDWFMLNLQETRNVTKLLFQEWFPEIVYNQHQSPPFPARIFVPPYSEPLNPNIPVSVMEGINEIGAAIKQRLAREEKPGALSYFGFDAWWDGGLRSVPAFHNMHGILTETAGNTFASPVTSKVAAFPPHFANGMPTTLPTVFYANPWLGGTWRLRDAVDYMLTADMAILDLAASRSQEFLYKAYSNAIQQIEAGKRGKPFAYIVPDDQWDSSTAREMLIRLQEGAVQISRSQRPFEWQGRNYAAGTIVIPAAQPFRGYLLDLLEPQHYPELLVGPNGTVKRPYDVAGWTLPYQMGVKTVRIDDEIPLSLERVETLEPLAPVTDHRDTSFFSSLAQLLHAGKEIRWSETGALVNRENAAPAVFARAPFHLRVPRVGVYESWIPNSDAGWTNWLFDRYGVPHNSLHNADLQAGHLNSRFDVIVLPAQSASGILSGIREGDSATHQRPEFTGGIELSGLYQLSQFVRAGGWLITFDQAGELPISNFPLAVKPLLNAPFSNNGGADAYYCPGSVLRITMEGTDPIAFGMPHDAYAFSAGGQAYDVTLLPEFNRGDRSVTVVARYAKKDVLASGFLSGASRVEGKPILVDARFGKGRVILFGFRPQFRGQSFGTFRLILNSVYLAASSS